MSSLPSDILAAIEDIVQQVGLGRVRAAAAQLGRLYAQGKAPREFTHEMVAAYAAMRLPGTFAAMTSVMQAWKDHVAPQRALRVLDVFAGPATFVLAARAVGVEIAEAVCVERSCAMRQLGEELLRSARIPTRVAWRNEELTEFLERGGPSFDLVVASYGLGEIPAPWRQRELASELWRCAQGHFLCVEPGTPAGSELVQSIRTMLVEQGGTVVVPCPHNGRCAYATAHRGWCHFNVRVGRTHLTRVIDGAEASFEDEKYCFVAASREKVAWRQDGRIVGHPRLSQAGMQLVVCLPNGEVKYVTVPKREKHLYRIARKLRWGDSLPPELHLWLRGECGGE